MLPAWITTTGDTKNNYFDMPNVHYTKYVLLETATCSGQMSTTTVYSFGVQTWKMDLMPHL